jgi:UDP-N-acetyl-D-glucosamine/UDP-N-acetyl-D-galactosamine dehydrogenase
MSDELRIVVVGLGYVGLPLAVSLAGSFDVVGMDTNPTRIRELKEGVDRTREVDGPILRQSRLKLSHDGKGCHGADVYIVTVPTPVDNANRPDLGPLIRACRAVSDWLDPARRPTVVFESTVYPGVTEEVCGPEIERCSGLRQGHDFRLGYSPERINPGDRVHSLEKITKIISAADEETLDLLETIYGRVTDAGVFRAASIATAEAAKVIENAQRDINIAFMNEITQIFSRLGISIWDVLAAASTKWNFLPFEPGLVGGHCIGVDPYYLSHRAQQFGYHPEVILAGRRTNDSMGAWIADHIHVHRGRTGRALVMGLTFKENVPDLRNSKVVDLIKRLRDLGHEVVVTDAVADPDQIERELGLVPDPEPSGPFDLVIGAVAHQSYRQIDGAHLSKLLARDATVADVKGMWRELTLPSGVDRWTL